MSDSIQFALQEAGLISEKARDRALFKARGREPGKKKKEPEQPIKVTWRGSKHAKKVHSEARTDGRDVATLDRSGGT